ncbi:hypothetical protein SAMN02745751_00307 [Dethiosulfatibacter aminovorans DSM 17477]|uniref:Uncharacterized protein n=1 Tax=Dethiosulfatibacter aminovorans DSM 17477 TaxID=1121476 RepID=A0A1M6AZU4_9FIRM|nr:hypothetical protein [Dethiosulfatibacter aminovorans]SHI41986.1 hypothetical protein SAMN02745751_00307 [Dethiosulfatibacter aminovorans DSM 17477]
MNDKELMEYLLQNNYIVTKVELNHPDMSFICMKSVGEPLDKYGEEFTLQTYDLSLLIDAKKIWKR